MKQISTIYLCFTREISVKPERCELESVIGDTPKIKNKIKI